jgi:hypothetical protein
MPDVNLVQRALGGLGGKVKYSRAKPAPSGTPDVNRDTKRTVQRSP